MRHLLAIALVLVASLAFAKPDRPTPKTPSAPKAATVPDVSFRCQFGIIQQSGADRRTVTIEQHGAWEAAGKIREDGALQVLWTNASGRQAHGVYRLVNGDLVGGYVYTDAGEVDETGRLVGEVIGERLVRVPEPEPDF